MKKWRKVKLGTLLTESKIVSEKPNSDKRIRVKLNVLGVKKRPITKDKKGATKYYTRKEGQFVYGKQNLHKGAFGIIPKELDGFESSSDIPAFDVDDSCYPEWIFYFFKKGNFYLKLESLAKGVGSKRIHPKQIFELDIYLPSKEEQRKVLDEIKRAETSNQKLIKEIDYQEENLSKLRRSILQDAVKGKLTKEWRAQNPTIKSASELLKKIKTEKELLIKEKKIKKEKLLTPISEDEIPFAIPDSWVWSRLSQLTSPESIITYGILKPVWVEKGVKTVRIKDMKNGVIVLDEILQCSKERANSFLKTQLLEGDILIAKDGGTLGKTAIVPKVLEGGNITQHVLRFSVASCFSTQFVRIVIDSPYGQEYMKGETRGAALPGVNVGDFRKMVAAIPPPSEQQAIIEKVNNLLANCDDLEQEIKASKKNIVKLMQSVLSELLGEENNVLIKRNFTKKLKETPTREIKYNSKTLLMDLVELLKENGKLHAEDLWKMSKYPKDIDAFYAELKEQIEVQKTIKEVVNEKGYLNLV